jgi:hypothetical protein
MWLIMMKQIHKASHGRKTNVLLIEVSLHVTITIHGFSKGPS